MASWTKPLVNNKCRRIRKKFCIFPNRRLDLSGATVTTKWLEYVYLREEFCCYLDDCAMFPYWEECGLATGPDDPWVNED